MVGALPAGAMALHWREDGFEPPPGAVELLRRTPGATVEAFRYGRVRLGRPVPPGGPTPRASTGGTSTHWELEEAGVTEEQARAADALHLPGQRALSDALFGGFARVVAGAHDRRVTADAYPHRLAIPTRWNDNDVYGHVNNVEYYAFFDTVINAWLIAEGGLDIHGGDVIGVCAESHCEFQRAARVPGDGAGRPARRPPRPVERALRDRPVRRGLREPAATGWFVHVFVDRAKRRPVEIPAGLRAALERLVVPAGS